MEQGDSLQNQWQRAKSGQAVALPTPENKIQEFNGGLVIIGLEQQKKEQREREEAMHMETQLICEQGLDTDEVIFLEEQEEKKYLFREQQKQEIADFKAAVANKIVKPETSYIEDLYHLNKKKKLEESKKKRKPMIGFAGPNNVKKAKLEDDVENIKEEENNGKIKSESTQVKVEPKETKTEEFKKVDDNDDDETETTGFSLVDY
jgi:hypothetical protein